VLINPEASPASSIWILEVEATVIATKEIPNPNARIINAGNRLKKGKRNQ